MAFCIFILLFLFFKRDWGEKKAWHARIDKHTRPATLNYIYLKTISLSLLSGPPDIFIFHGPDFNLILIIVIIIIIILVLKSWFHRKK